MSSAAITADDDIREDCYYDAVVVGVGGIGSFALRALAKSSSSNNNKKFLGIERYQVGHSKGSSHGRSRVYRTAYFEHAQYVPYCQYSLREFETLQNETGTKLLEPCGTLIIEAVDFHGASSSSSCWSSSAAAAAKPRVPPGPAISAAKNAAHEHGIAVQHLNHQELEQNFPQFNYSNSKNIELHGLLETGNSGGLVRPERVQAAIQRQLEDQYSSDDISDDNSSNNNCSVTILENTVVLSYETITADDNDDESSRSLVRLRIQQQQQQDGGGNGPCWQQKIITTRALLLAAGAWTGELVPAWRPFLTPVRQLQGWLDVSSTTTNTTDEAEESSKNPNNSSKSSRYHAGTMPTFYYTHPDFPTALYGIPRDIDDDDNENHYYSNCIKIGLHQRNVPVLNMERDHPTAPTAAEVDEVRAAMAVAFDSHAWQQQQQQHSSSSSSDDNKDTTSAAAAASAKYITTESQHEEKQQQPSSFILLPPPLSAVPEVRPCLYTMTPDAHFIVDSPSPNVFAVAGGSGHAYKMAPALGQMLADYAVLCHNDAAAVRRKWKTDFLAVSRFDDKE